MTIACANLAAINSIQVFSIKKDYSSYLQAHQEAKTGTPPISEREWTRRMLARKAVTVGGKTFVSRVNPID